MLIKKLRNKCLCVCSITFVLIFMMLFTSGCTTNSGTITTKLGTTFDADGRVVDNDINAKIKSEKNLIGGQLSISGDVATVTMVVKDGVSKKDIQSLGDKYSDMAKKRYRDKNIWVQAVQNGQSVLDIKN